MHRDDTIVDVLRRHAEQRRGEAAFAFAAAADRPVGRCSFQELQATVQLLARRLERRGLYRRRVLLVYPPGLDFIGTFFGCLSAGVVAVPMRAPRSAAERGHLLRVAQASGARHVFTEGRTLQALDAATRNGLAAMACVEPLEWPGIEAPVPRRREPRTLPPRPQDLAYLHYTVDSSGALQCLMLSHAGLLARHADRHGNADAAGLLDTIVASLFPPEAGPALACEADPAPSLPPLAAREAHCVLAA